MRTKTFLFLVAVMACALSCIYFATTLKMHGKQQQSNLARQNIEALANEETIAVECRNIGDLYCPLSHIKTDGVWFDKKSNPTE